ncbi:MAG: cation:proton antiporter [Chroococcus sp. CMT-3BRIN-NPC107]|jgi:Kef-type K+ transport system membrane component KefB/nucleotide-binding universal stress UspA family protein|nr:cation:proton antiporter [Chroococcus sp. CMT-3BRIN-NPC107]
MNAVVLVLVEVLVVIGLSRLVGLGCRAINQPLVIGEIIAGIMLGPSLLGLIAPSLATTLFPAETIPYLFVLSQIGLIFFMFLIGLELNPKYLSGQLEIAILVSHVSILAPFSLGTLLAVVLYPQLSNGDVSFTAFALFLGAAMSITAFPVLARIITENNLQGTRLGTLALTCAAVDDVTAWCVLALAITVARTGTINGAIPTIIYSLVYIGLMVTVGRWFLKRVARYYQRVGKLNQLLLAGIYAGVVASALITELIGIHFIFGAFLLGAVMPKDEGLVREIAEKTEDFVLIFLLPIFFAYSGLRTQVGLLNRPELWLLCAAVVAVAISGKYFGTYISARVSGIENREASALGWLMNTRGLTELIVLNIGLNLGVISPLLFTMLVIMALVTTFMTSPLLEWTYPKRLIRLDTVEPETKIGLKAEVTYRVLVPVANVDTQKGLIQLAAAIALNNSQGAVVHPLSLVELEEDYAFQSLPAEADRLMDKRRQQLDQLVATLEPAEIRPFVQPLVRVTNDVARATEQITSQNKIDLMLVGWHRPAFTANRLGGRVGQILSMAPVDVGVYIDRGQAAIEKLLVAYSGNLHDDLALELALRMLVSSETRTLSILRVVQAGQTNSELSYELSGVIQNLTRKLRDRIDIQVQQAAEPISVAVEASAHVDLTIAGTSRAWGIERQTLGRYTDQLAIQCKSSLLITRRYSQVTSHLASVVAPSTDIDKSGV